MGITNCATGAYQGFALIEYFCTFTSRVGINPQLVIR